MRTCLLREQMLDKAGEETHDFWEAASVEARIEPLPFRPKAANGPTPHSRECVFYPPLAAAGEAPARIQVRIRMRPMGMDVLSDLVKTNHLAADIPARMQTLTVVASTFVYKSESRSYESESSMDGTCDEWPCLMDPLSSACPN